jgi:hypothetical protein
LRPALNPIWKTEHDGHTNASNGDTVFGLEIMSSPMVKLHPDKSKTAPNRNKVTGFFERFPKI